MLLLVLHNLLIPVTILVGIILFICVCVVVDHAGPDAIKKVIASGALAIGMLLLVWGAPNPDYNVVYKDKVVIKEPIAGQLYTECVKTRTDATDIHRDTAAQDMEKIDVGCTIDTQRHMNLLKEYSNVQPTK
jgi:hypothetical protein